MKKALTKSWLRREHRRSETIKSFREWCRSDGRALIEQMLGMEKLADLNTTTGDTPALYPLGLTKEAADLVGLQEGEGCVLARLALEEQQAAKKARSRMRSIGKGKKTKLPTKADKKGKI